MEDAVPLFMLNAILFPHMPLSLHVFEERYKEMLESCVESGSPFGVIPCAEGETEGSAAVPGAIGTLAVIRQMNEVGDRRSNVLVTGGERFKVSQTVSGRPYLTAKVLKLEENDDGITDNLVAELSTAFCSYVGESVPHLPQEAQLLSYVVAAVLEAGFDSRKKLLACQSTKERIEMEITILRYEAEMRAEGIEPLDYTVGRFSAN